MHVGRSHTCLIQQIQNHNPRFVYKSTLFPSFCVHGLSYDITNTTKLYSRVTKRGCWTTSNFLLRIHSHDIQSVSTPFLWSSGTFTKLYFRICIAEGLEEIISRSSLLSCTVSCALSYVPLAPLSQPPRAPLSRPPCAPLPRYLIFFAC